MADDIDKANEYAEKAREMSVKNIQNKPLAVQAVGHCLSCAEPLAHGLRWCDNACRDDWQRFNPGA